jgi:hypothetical protein
VNPLFGKHTQKSWINFMKWEYRIVRADTVENFEASLNELGTEGWEATSGAYAAGESRKVSLGQGMPASIAVGAPTWVALMKRPVAS